uniref:Transcription factor IIIC subunit 5 HTH domain-containing protein n=1 Tax=Glossina brevipalpis TaxID=37001 RepID=A0A1A9W049_9MUSC
MSIQLSGSSLTEFAVILYPGLVKNLNGMLDTLGGITKVSQALEGETKRLELRYHYENPFNKALCGEINKRAGLLLSIKVRRSKRDRSKPPQYKVIQVKGLHLKVRFCVCNNLYLIMSFLFPGLCDFQYLPLVPHTENKHELKMMMHSIMPQSVIDLDFFNRTEVPLITVPTMFARYDNVHNNIFRGDFSNEDGQHEVLGVCQKSSYENRDIVMFNMVDSFPARPDPQIIKRMKVKYVSDEQFEKVKKLFEECPIWTRIGLLYESGVSNDKLKCITPSMAYYFSTGPWRTLYVRYGYDPRKDFNSRYYQTFDFRLRFRSGIAEFVSDRKTSIKKRQKNPYEINSLVQDIDYPYFDEHKLPRSRQCILRYCDIHMSKIQEMLEKIPSPLAGAMCNERTGWLPSGFDSQVRQIVSNVIKDLLKNHYRKEQIHAEVESCENMGQEAEDEEGAVSDEGGPDDFMNDDNIEEILGDMQIEADEIN